MVTLDRSTNLKPCDIPLIVFKGTNAPTDTIVPIDPFHVSIKPLPFQVIFMGKQQNGNVPLPLVY